MLKEVYYRAIACDTPGCYETDLVKLDYDSCAWCTPDPEDVPIKSLPNDWTSKPGVSVGSELTSDGKIKGFSKEITLHYCYKCSRQEIS